MFLVYFGVVWCAQLHAVNLPTVLTAQGRQEGQKAVSVMNLSIINECRLWSWWNSSPRLLLTCTPIITK